MPELTKPGEWMANERLDELAGQSMLESSQDDWNELVRELKRLRRGATLLMRVDGHASQHIPGYVGSSLAQEAKRWLYS